MLLVEREICVTYEPYGNGEEIWQKLRLSNPPAGSGSRRQMAFG